jgi:hypothetical protein
MHTVAPGPYPGIDAFVQRTLDSVQTAMALRIVNHLSWYEMSLVHEFACAAALSNVTASLDTSVSLSHELPGHRKEVDVIVHTNPTSNAGGYVGLSRKLYGLFEMKCITRAAGIRDVFLDALRIKSLPPLTGRRYCVALIAPPPTKALEVFPNLFTVSRQKWKPACAAPFGSGTRRTWHLLSKSDQPTTEYRDLELTTVYAARVPTFDGDRILASWLVHR